MRMDAEGIMEALFAAYAIGDLDANLAYFAPDARFAIYVDTELLPYAGEVSGRAQIRNVLEGVTRDFELLHYEAKSIVAQGAIVRCQAAFTYRHRASGEVIDGIERIEAEVKNGLITSYREFHDVERIRAFLRLCNEAGQAPAGTLAQPPSDPDVASVETTSI